MNTDKEVKVRIHCQDPWFTFLKNGIKTIEGRKYSEKYQKLKKGDIIEFYKNGDSFKAQIIDIKVYENLDEYLNKNDLNNILPGVKSIEEGRKIYTGFTSEEELKKYKFSGIYIKRL